MSDARPRAGGLHTGHVAGVVAGGAATVLAALTIAVVVHPGPLPGEVGWVRAWQRLGAPVPEVAEFVRVTSGTEGMLLIGIVPAIWAIVHHGRRGAAAVGIILGAMLVVQPVMKELVDRPRPAATQVEVRAGHSSMSFPSGHSLATTAVFGTAAGIALIRGRRAIAVAATVPIAANLIAPAVQGVHWPSDSVAGTIVGAGAAALAVGVLTIDARSG